MIRTRHVKPTGSASLAATTMPSNWELADDTALVGAALAGDRAAFAAIYTRYADRLYDYCCGLVSDRDTAADCVQETFCIAAVELSALRDPAKLRPWLYSIARHQSMRILKSRRRESATDELPDRASDDLGPDAVVARNELVVLIAEAERGLSERDREVFRLAYRRELTGSELAQELGVSQASAKKMVQRLRSTFQGSLDALLLAKRSDAGQHRCPELVTLLAGWNRQLTILLRKRISRHVVSCATCNARRELLTPAWAAAC